MFDITNPKTSARLEKIIGDSIQKLIDGCALIFILMIFTLLAVIGYLIYVICTM